MKWIILFKYTFLRYLGVKILRNLANDLDQTGRRKSLTFMTRAQLALHSVAQHEH